MSYEHKEKVLPPAETASRGYILQSQKCYNMEAIRAQTGEEGVEEPLSQALASKAYVCFTSRLVQTGGRKSAEVACLESDPRASRGKIFTRPPGSSLGLARTIAD